MLLPYRGGNRKKKNDAHALPLPRQQLSDTLLQIYPVPFISIHRFYLMPIIIFKQANCHVDNAIYSAKRMRMIHPGILVIGADTYILVDSKVLKIQCGSFSELIAYLLASYYVFNIEYDDQLKNVFGFLEFVGKVNSDRLVNSEIVKSVVRKIFRELPLSTNQHVEC
jgi:hypothetical protein